MAKEKKNTVAIATELALPIANEMNIKLWDVRFEKEGSTWYLRYFIDKENGINITECENFSRAIDPILDKEDPIEQSYTLEVSSPGVERELTKQWHFDEYVGKQVVVRNIRPVDGIKEYTGVLKGLKDDIITLEIDNKEISVNKSQTAYTRLVDDFDYKGA